MAARFLDNEAHEDHDDDLGIDWTQLEEDADAFSFDMNLSKKWREKEKRGKRNVIREEEEEEEADDDPTCGGFVVDDHNSDSDEGGPCNYRMLNLLSPESFATGRENNVRLPSRDSRTRTLATNDVPLAQHLDISPLVVDEERERETTETTGSNGGPAIGIQEIMPGTQVRTNMEVQGGQLRSFRIQCKRFLLTYKTHVNKTNIELHFATLASNRMPPKVFHCAHETGSSTIPYEHSHVVVEFARNIDTRNPRFFDYEEIHPHIRKLTSGKAMKDAETYISKEDPDMAHLRVRGSLIDTIINAKSALEAVRLVAEKPGDIMGVLAGYRLKERQLDLPASIDPSTRAWQSKLLTICTQPADARSITWVYDRIGNTGKSSFAAYLEDELRDDDGYDWFSLSNMGKATDIFHLVGEAIKEGWRAKGVVVDLSRSFESRWDIYASLEAMKNGRITSTKYMGGRHRFASPHVVVFANWWPDTTKLSIDRWKIFEITPENDWEPRSVADHVPEPTTVCSCGRNRIQLN